MLSSFSWAKYARYIFPGIFTLSEVCVGIPIVKRQVQSDTADFISTSAVVMTDFMCWVPLAFMCLLVQCGVFTVGPETYAWMVGLVLPINSAINPFLYTFASIITDHL